MRTAEAVQLRRRSVALITLALGVLGLAMLIVRGPSAAGAGRSPRQLTSTTVHYGTTAPSTTSGPSTTRTAPTASLAAPTTQHSVGTARSAASSSSTTTTVPDTTVTVTTTENLVVGSVANTTTTSTTVAALNEPDNSATAHRTINWKVWGVVAGLVFIALVMAVLTWRYWRRTAPKSSNVVRSGQAFTVPSAFDDPTPGSSAGQAAATGAASRSAWEAPQFGAEPQVRPTAATVPAPEQSPVVDQLAAEAARGAGGVVHPAAVDLGAASAGVDPEVGGRSRSRRRGSRFADVDISLPPSGIDDPHDAR